jgi:hypothetical protein
VALTQAGPAWLFCPADRPERFQKAAAAADVVILDLEDGVAAKDREAARIALIETTLDPDRTVVRINPSATADHQLDLEALKRTAYTTVMLAKTEDPQQVRDLAPLDVVVLIETPPRTCSRFWAAPRTGTRTAPTARWPGTCGHRRCWRPRLMDGWHWIRSTSISRTSTGSARKSTMRSPSVSTPRSRYTRRRSR